jgi:hypothetical protein
MNEDKFITWRGQIVDDKVWKDNSIVKKWKGTNNIPGWGDRYRVRVIGRETETQDISDDQLEWATLSYPVTAGSGSAGSYQTANLRKGSFVWGFYEDPDAKSGLVIIGCFGNNDQTRLAQSIPLKGFVPFSGYVGEKVSVNDIPGEGSTETNPREVCTLNGNLEDVFSDQIEKDDGNKKTYLSLPTDCDKLQLKSIQTEIQKFIQDIQEFKKRVNSWKYTILKPINEEGQEFSLEEYIQYKVDNVSNWVAGRVKIIVTGIQQFTTNKINNIAKDTYYNLFPNERSELKKVMEEVNDNISCLFRKIIGSLLGIASNFLKTIAERFINAPLCAIENIIASLLGKLTGLIGSAVSAILAPLKALLSIFDSALSAFDIAGDIIGFVTNLLSFLSCDEKPACPEVTEWSPWKGATAFNVGSDSNNLIEKVKDFASSAQQVTDPGNFDFNLDFSDIFQDTCNTGATFCGPPTVEFYGGGGSGATGNAIISSTGDILGVDMTNLGSGYTSSPFVNFVDNCGKGNGAVGRAIVNSSGQVSRVIIDNPGFGYLSAPNGDQGGDGRTWATRCDYVVKRSNGIYDRPYIPGETFQANPGDEVYIQGVSTFINQTQTITVPECPEVNLPSGQNPSLNDGRYPIVLELDDVFIDSPGINYNPTKDKVIITPNNGAELKPQFDSLGSLIKVNVIKPGIGFTEYPTIEIETETGYNATLLPVFRVNRVGDEIEEQVVLPSQVISVIDCVGKV